MAPIIRVIRMLATERCKTMYSYVELVDEMSVLFVCYVAVASAYQTDKRGFPTC